MKCTFGDRQELDLEDLESSDRKRIISYKKRNTEYKNINFSDANKSNLLIVENWNASLSQKDVTVKKKEDGKTLFKLKTYELKFNTQIYVKNNDNQSLEDCIKFFINENHPIFTPEPYVDSNSQPTNLFKNNQENEYRYHYDKDSKFQ